MEMTFYVMGSKMNGLEESLQLIANNLANTDTPGFKRTLSGFSSVLEGMTQQAIANPAAPSPEWPVLSERTLDLTQGSIRTTGRTLDLAIQGKGFFAVDTPNGPRYTRKGRLYQNSDGDLTDSAGHRIVSQSGALRLPPEAGQITIARDGQVLADGKPIGQISLVDVPEPALLVPEGSGLLRNDGKPTKSAVGSQITQGAIEESNVKPMQEMVALIEVSRAYEAATRIMKREEALNKQLISNMG